MLWVAFAIWIAYGVWQTRRSHEVRRKVLTVPREKRALLGAFLFIAGTALLFGGLALAAPYLSTNQAIAWIGVTLIGLAFVHAVTMATALLVTLVHPGVTNDHDPTSTLQNQSENQHEEPSA